MEWTCPRCGKKGLSGTICDICLTPMPPLIEPTPSLEQASQLRFIENSNADGSKTIIDRDMGYTIKYTEQNGYIAYNDDGQEVYHINQNGVTLIKAKNLNGNDIIVTGNIMTIEDMNRNMSVVDCYGREFSISSGYVTRIIEYNEDGSIYCTEIYDTDGSFRREYASGYTEYYTNDRLMYKTITEDGKIHYNGLSSSNQFGLYRNSDETYSVNNSNKEKNEVVDAYVYNENSDISLNNLNGNVLHHDSHGDIIQKENPDSTVYKFNFDEIVQNGINNRKLKYSRINHIEYDEEAYDKILLILNIINNSCKSIITTACSNIENSINIFPDNYSSSGIDSVKSNIIEHFDLIKSLSEMTNYSLLAYQMCDDSMKEGLYLLVDSLFDDNEANLANNFKNIIRSSIEDRNHDNILEYKENTNFEILSNNSIVKFTLYDNNGNKWYLNKNNTVIGIDGKDLKIKYSGETFDLMFDDNGVAILKDSNGKPLNIFGDYNMDTRQFGGNQMALKKSYNNIYVNDILSKYFPNSSSEEKIALLDKASSVGCGYTAVADFVFKQFEGNEQGFYDTFGFPMYNIKRNKLYLAGGSPVSVDYNYEPLIVDLFCNTNSESGKYNISNTIKRSTGTGARQISLMSNYLRDNYNIRLDSNQDEIHFIVDEGYSLYNLDGTLYLSNGEAHAMVEVGKNENGQQIVSSWGKKYIYEPAQNRNYRSYYQSIWKEKMYHV